MRIMRAEGVDGMAITIRLDVEDRINVKGLINAVQGDKLWLFAATEWHRLYKDWVPMKNGTLYSNVVFRPKEIEHMAPYAHYMYEGKVYGPNIPISEGGAITGFYSPRNRPKSPTGKSLKYSHGQHPKACAKWDQAAAPTQLPKLVDSMQGYVDQGRL